MGIFTHSCSLPSPGLFSRSWTCHCGQTWQIQLQQQPGTGLLVSVIQKGGDSPNSGGVPPGFGFR